MNIGDFYNRKIFISIKNVFGLQMVRVYKAQFTRLHINVTLSLMLVTNASSEKKKN